MKDKFWHAFNQFEATMYNTYGKTKAIEILSHHITNYVDYLEEHIKILETNIADSIKLIKDEALYDEDWNRCCDDLYTSNCDKVLEILARKSLPQPSEFDIKINESINKIVEEKMEEFYERIKEDS